MNTHTNKEEHNMNTLNNLEQVTNSFELYELINEHRVMASKHPYRHHSDFLAKVRRELDDDLDSHENVWVKNTAVLSKNDLIKAYKLSRKEIYTLSPVPGKTSSTEDIVMIKGQPPIHLSSFDFMALFRKPGNDKISNRSC